jgi:hypothetical protein
MEETVIYALHTDFSDKKCDDITDAEFIEKGKYYTLTDFLYNLNRDFINTEKYWFRAIKKYGIVSGMFCDINIKLEQISKPQARKLFDEGKEIYVSPCNMKIFNSLGTLLSVTKVNNNANFDRIVKSYENYNCNNNEVGKYASFFKQIK